MMFVILIMSFLIIGESTNVDAQVVTSDALNDGEIKLAADLLKFWDHESIIYIWYVNPLSKKIYIPKIICNLKVTQKK